MITLIVEMTIVGFINYQINIEEMIYDIKHGKVPANYYTLYSLKKVARAAFVMLAYFFLNPLMLFLLAKYVTRIKNIHYAYLFSIYGYSFTSFIICIGLTVI